MLFSNCPGGRDTYQEFDEWNNFTKEVYPDGSTVTYLYEPKYSNLVKKVDERGIVTTYEYADVGNLVDTLHIYGFLSQQAFIPHSYGYFKVIQILQKGNCIFAG